jgi:hypothetical protein
VLVHVVLVRVMQMPVMEIIHMIVVLDRRVSTIRTVLMRVGLVVW